MIKRIAPALVLAAAISLGTTGCGFFVPIATTENYSPSDGVETNVADVKVRNLLLVTNGEEANIVFTGVNSSDAPAKVTLKLVQDGAQKAQEVITLDPGTTVIGTDERYTVPLAGVIAGAMIDGFIETGGQEVQLSVPVVDGTLDEYKTLVP